MLYTGITRAWFTAIEANAESQTNIAISGDQGTATGVTPLGKVTVGWIFDEADGTLTVAATKKPFFLPESELESKLTALVNSSKPAA